MYTIIDTNGFALWVQKEEPTEIFTQIPIPIGMKKPQLIDDVWVEKFVEEVPQKVKKLALKLALIKIGISTSSITNAIYAMPDSLQKYELITLWEDAEFFERDNESLNSMATSLGISSEQLDQLFILAK